MSCVYVSLMTWWDVMLRLLFWDLVHRTPAPVNMQSLVLTQTVHVVYISSSSQCLSMASYLKQHASCGMKRIHICSEYSLFSHPSILLLYSLYTCSLADIQSVMWMTPSSAFSSHQQIQLITYLLLKGSSSLQAESHQHKDDLYSWKYMYIPYILSCYT